MFGAEILSNSPELKGIAPTVLHHHEDFSGGGYPGGISRDLIPLGARIIRVADTYDALTGLRPYRTAHSPAEALKLIVAGAGAQFDPDVVDAFQARVGRSPVTDELLGGAPGAPAVAGPRGTTGSLNLYRAAYYATEALKALTNGATARLEQAGAAAGRPPPERAPRPGNAARPDEPTAAAAAESARNRTRTLDS